MLHHGDVYTIFLSQLCMFLVLSKGGSLFGLFFIK